MNNLINQNNNYEINKIETVEECEKLLEIEYKLKEQYEKEGIKLIEDKQVTPTIPSYEVAKMMDKGHWLILRDIEGSKDRKGIIEILTDTQMVVSDYFIESSYKDISGKENKCYECTKMGCEILANKMTGEKGILFTIKYVKRFNEMENVLENSTIDSYQIDNRVQRAERLIHII